MGVLRPLRMVIENYPEDLVEEFDAANHPNRPEMGTREVPFSRVICIEKDDFMEEPTKGYFRLAPGREVRLRYAYVVKCVGVVKDDSTGEIVEVRCTYDPETRGGSTPDGRKIKGTIHWVSEPHSIGAEVRLYDRLFNVPNPGGEKGGPEWKNCLNPASVEILRSCKLEPGLSGATPESRFQFERQGYFTVDPVDSNPDSPVFNRTVTLRDSWAKSQ
jgi:glutaminyl-tRNA synthetase